ncbi:unnamed protein product, partial [Effrenium voratum]
ESSSVQTFKCVINLLNTVPVSWFILENVDLDSEPDGNLDLIMKALSSSGFGTHADGYQVKAFKILTSDYGLPSRRIRLYFVGVSRSSFPQFSMKCVERNLNMFTLKCQPPDAEDFMLDDDSATGYASIVDWRR